MFLWQMLIIVFSIKEVKTKKFVASQGKHVKGVQNKDEIQVS